jgi:NADH dehydrogenase FAD-containing subunit
MSLYPSVEQTKEEKVETKALPIVVVGGGLAGLLFTYQSSYNNMA